MCVLTQKARSVAVINKCKSHQKKNRTCASGISSTALCNTFRLYRSNYEWCHVAVGIGGRSVVNTVDMPQGDLVLCPVILVALLRPYVAGILGGSPASGRITHCTLPVGPSVQLSHRDLRMPVIQEWKVAPKNSDLVNVTPVARSGQRDTV